MTTPKKITHADKIAELEAKHQQERDRLNTELEIYQLIPEDLLVIPNMVHPHKLYDRVGSIHFKTERYTSLKKAGQEDPSPKTIARLLEVFPPVDAAIFRDGCVGIRTLDNARKAYDRAQARMVEGSETSARVQPIAPFWLRFAPASYNGEMAIYWIGRSAAGLLEIQISFPLYSGLAPKIGRVEVRYANRNGADDRRRVISTTPIVTLEAKQIGNARAEWISYYSGSEWEPGDKILYYDACNGEPAKATILDLFKAIGEEI